jgi:hypothetical protein
MRPSNEETTMSDMPHVSDELLDRILSEPKARELLGEALRNAGVQEPLEQMPRETQRAAVAAMLATMQEIEQGDGRPVEVPEIDPALVHEIFADPDAQDLLRDVMSKSNLPGAPADLPFQVQLAIVQMLVQQGAIEISPAGPKDGAS